MNEHLPNIFSLLICISISYTATIQGILTDKRTGSPLIGANVMLEGISLGSSTDENGFYLISNINKGTIL